MKKIQGYTETPEKEMARLISGKDQCAGTWERKATPRGREKN